MGIAFRPSDHSYHLLLPTTTIGRAPDATIQIDPGNDTISRQQLLIRWEQEGWKIQPLSHRSPTWLNGRRLKPSDLTLLQEEDRVAMGDPAVELVFVNIEPPKLYAFHPGSGERRSGDSDGLRLPGITLRQSAQQGWQIERAEGVEKLDLSGLRSPEDTVALGEWRVGAFEEGTKTVEAFRSLDQVLLVLMPMHNLESVRLVLRSSGWEVDLGHRAEFYPLYILAQARLAGPDGWMDTEQLTKGVGGYAWGTLECYLGRIGMLIERAGVTGGRDVIESARRIRRIRVPPSQIVISKES